MLFLILTLSEWLHKLVTYIVTIAQRHANLLSKYI